MVQIPPPFNPGPVDNPPTQLDPGNLPTGTNPTLPDPSGLLGGSASSITTPPSGMTSEQQSAKAIIDDTLAQYGLQSLGDFAWREYLANTPISQIMLDIRGTQEYKARFPAMQSLAQGGHAITESQYIDYERNAMGLMKAAGLPEGFYDQPEDFTNFLTNNIALPELKTRLDMASSAAYQWAAPFKDFLAQNYGVTDGELTAFFIDPDKALPLLQREFGAGVAGGTATQTGFQGLTRAQAEGVANLGLTQGQLSQGFGNLANLQPQVLGGLPGQNQPQISNDAAIQAQFYGDVEAQNLIQNRETELVNQFKSGGGVATTSKGAVGAGVAR